MAYVVAGDVCYLKECSLRSVCYCRTLQLYETEQRSKCSKEQTPTEQPFIDNPPYFENLDHA